MHQLLLQRLYIRLGRHKQMIKVGDVTASVNFKDEQQFKNQGTTFHLTNYFGMEEFFSSCHMTARYIKKPRLS